MRTAIDSSVLIDVLVDDENFAETSFAALHKARQEGSLCVSEAVVAEVVPVLTTQDSTLFWEAWSIEYVPIEFEAARLAGRMFASYLRQGGRRNRVVADFLIGAHAMLHADRLLTRDRGYYRDYFDKLEVWDVNG